jgi:hypothetical protein
MPPNGRKLITLFVILLAAAMVSCNATGRGVHEKELDLQFSNRYLIPSFAHTKAGLPFTGAAYGTFFGDATSDCVEWEGTFKEGRPDGSFKIYSNCDVLRSTVFFSHGIKVKGT